LEDNANISKYLTNINEIHHPMEVNRAKHKQEELVSNKKSMKQIMVMITQWTLIEQNTNKEEIIRIYCIDDYQRPSPRYNEIKEKRYENQN